jgi:Zn-dependent peptidase ImmA (M78 family)/transcriptional regulator with XRE-family HTH domain
MSPKPSARETSLGKRLRSAREAAGLTTRDVSTALLANGLKVTHATVSNYERGVTAPSADCLAAFAHIYRRSVEWLAGAGHELAGVRYRCLKATREGEKHEYEGRALRWFEVYFHVEKLLKSPLRVLKQHDSFTVRIDESGADVALRVRKDMKLGKYPLPSTARLLEDFGVHVVSLATKSRIDGLAARVGNSRVVVLNPLVAADRMRLNALHELAHHLFEDCVEGGHLTSDEIEARAFDFAVGMLIPDFMLKEAMESKSIVRLVQFKERYGISLAAMFYRARQKNYISPGTYQRVMIEFSKHGLRKQEPGEVLPDRPLRMEYLIDKAVFTRTTDYDQLARVSGLSADEIEARVFEARRATPTSLDSSETDSFSFEAFRAELDSENIDHGKTQLETLLGPGRQADP